ncbi:hypothetical protein ELH26_14415 [Rhizobium leguminosarum]|uniref:hypothetical protein n=1 Tax=Rhizobium leguminosarum TaxID=384 RepID=UPI0010313D7D|nr:hypothetical protein [Rhizobium leguminosarum]TBC95139.1 hypothetical protein ELH26_14415 [Rhizobium leguminosarum]
MFEVIRSRNLRTKAEPVQPGNPHRLTVRQHVFPRKSIQRFANDRDFVDLVDGLRKTIRPAKAGDKIFCADRAWDERTEAGFMKSAEDNFQALADEIAEGRNAPLTAEENFAVSMFYSMWHVRSRQRELPDQFLKFHGVTGQALTKNEHEILEVRGALAFRHDGSVAARHLNGLQIQLKASKIASKRLKDVRWGIIRAFSGEFCVPDVPVQIVIPVTPSVCLVENAASGTISAENVAAINRGAVFTSQKYFFARDVKGCGLGL